MPRSIRLEYPGAFYHVMARGNRRESIYRDEEDRRFFLKTLGEACGMTGWRVHAWVLLRNHYHLLIETPEPNLVAGMQWLQNTYTRRFNVRHRLWGRLFGDRYKAVLVQGAGYYYETLLDYAMACRSSAFAQRGECEPANPPPPPTTTRTAQSPATMDNPVKKCRLTPISDPYFPVGANGDMGDTQTGHMGDTWLVFFTFVFGGKFFPVLGRRRP